jgi:hypothetical protein
MLQAPAALPSENAHDTQSVGGGEETNRNTLLQGKLYHVVRMQKIY